MRSLGNFEKKPGNSWYYDDFKFLSTVKLDFKNRQDKNKLGFKN